MGTPTPAEVIAEAVQAEMNEVVFGESNAEAFKRITSAVLDALAATGFVVVQLPKPVDKSLSLTEETRSHSTYDPQDPWATAYEHRWVTPWSAVEPKPAQKEQQ